MYVGSFGQGLDPAPPSTQTLPGGTSPPGGGVSPTSLTPDGSGLAPSTGSGQLTLMSNWTYHPAVVMGMQQNPAVFQTPRTNYVAWRQLADSILVQLGVVDPNNTTGYGDAVWALASVYGYYWLAGVGGAFGSQVQQRAAAAAQTFLSNDAFAMMTYSSYAAAKMVAAGVPGAPKPRTTGVRQKMTVIGKPTPPKLAAAPAAAASSTPWIIGGVAAVGVAAYFLL